MKPNLSLGLLLLGVQLTSSLVPGQTNAPPADPLSHWSLRRGEALALNGPLLGVASGNGVFVVAGSGGVLYTSSDARKWTSVATTFSSLVDVTFGEGEFLVTTASDAVLKSSDGVVWRTILIQPNPSFTDLDHLRFVNGNYFAFGTKAIHMSQDGLKWTTAPLSFNPRSAAFGNQVYVAAGASKTVLVSSDGLSWTETNTGITNNFAAFNEVIFQSGYFYAVGGIRQFQGAEVISRGLIIRSADGLSWTQLDSGAAMLLSGIAYGAGQFVITGGDVEVKGTPLVYPRPQILTSSDGEHWTLAKDTGNSVLGEVVYSNGMFVGIGNYSSVEEIVSSADGRTWRSYGAPRHLRGVTYGNDAFVAVGDHGILLRSENGADWTEMFNPTMDSLSDICYGAGLYVAVGNNGRVLRSQDGKVWSPSETVTPYGLKQVIRTPGEFLAVGGESRYQTPYLYGGNSVILASPDGITWRSIYNGPSDLGSLNDIAYGDGLYLAVGDRDWRNYVARRNDSTVLLSKDEITWSSLPISSQAGQAHTEYWNGRFAALVKNSGAAVFFLQASADPAGIIESPQWRPPLVSGRQRSQELYGLQSSSRGLLALGYGGLHATTDGQNWRWYDAGTPVPVRLYDVASGKNTFVAVGENETILQSDLSDSGAITIRDVAWTNGIFRTSFDSMPGVEYVLEATSTLDKPAWVEITRTIGTGGAQGLIDSAATVPQRYYRIRAR